MSEPQARTPTAAHWAAVDALIRLLPPPDSIWPTQERIVWLESMEALLRLMYDPAGARIEFERRLTPSTAPQDDQMKDDR